jgi:RNA polymerase sigma factor (sigma-70 family)
LANSAILHHLRRAALGGATDEELLARYVATRDEEAFEAIVRRHGPMVLGVCRRLLRDLHDAHDAFQATFLVLVKKAGSVSPAAMLPNWLHGVARQTAARARCAAARRGLRERQVVVLPELETEPAAPDDLGPLLDEELARLPANNRAAVVSVHLEGRTHEEAARRLGWPVGTLASRLSRGRQMLARRLGRRGLDPAAATPVPASLVASTVRAGCLGGSDQAAGAALTEGVLNAMFLKKVKATVAVVLVAGVFALGGGLLGRGGAAEGSPRPREAANPAPAPVAKPKDKPASKAQVEIRYDGKGAEVRAIIAGGQLLATADKVNFDSGKDQLILEGNVKVRFQNRQGDKPQIIEGRKIIHNLKTGHVQGEGVRSLQGAGQELRVPPLGPVPVPLDFGFPIDRGREDAKQVFNFYLGFLQ